jgi:DUF1680 family protein
MPASTRRRRCTGYPKLYGTPEHSFWCCTGTGMENHAKYGDAIWFHTGDALIVNQFIASELQWRDKGVRIRQATAFPDAASTRLTIHTARPAMFALRLRHPAWCRKLTIRLNGRPLTQSAEAGRYVEIERTWGDGDVLDVELPMHVYLAPLPHVADVAVNVAAVMFGPVVLAARMGRADMKPGDDIVASQYAYGEVLKRPAAMPSLAIGSAGVESVVRRVAGPALSFRARASNPETEFELVPFHRIAHERYSLYWQLT